MRYTLFRLNACRIGRFGKTILRICGMLTWHRLERRRTSRFARLSFGRARNAFGRRILRSWGIAFLAVRFLRDGLGCSIILIVTWQRLTALLDLAPLARFFFGAILRADQPIHAAGRRAAGLFISFWLVVRWSEKRLIIHIRIPRGGS
jgi:hypothetical protein